MAPLGRMRLGLDATSITAGSLTPKTCGPLDAVLNCLLHDPAFFYLKKRPKAVQEPVPRKRQRLLANRFPDFKVKVELPKDEVPLPALMEIEKPVASVEEAPSEVLSLPSEEVLELEETAEVSEVVSPVDVKAELPVVTPPVPEITVPVSAAKEALPPTQVVSPPKAESLRSPEHVPAALPQATLLPDAAVEPEIPEVPSGEVSPMSAPGAPKTPVPDMGDMGLDSWAADQVTIQELPTCLGLLFFLDLARDSYCNRHVLKDPEQSLEAAGVSDGDHLTAVVQQGKLTSTAGAFALWSYGGDKIVTWGHNKVSRNCAVQDNLGSVQLVQGTRSPVFYVPSDEPEYRAGAFAAILEDGSVVTWGDPMCGGDSSAVSAQLRNAQQVQATCSAFAAILADGSVVTWGDHLEGGDSSEVQDQLRNVKQIEASDDAFAAILQGGSVVTWGIQEGDSSEVQDQLRSVQQVQATRSAFAAIRADGSVVTWGDPDEGGDSSKVQRKLRTVQQVQSTGRAFAAILEDGSVVTWGDPHAGGDSSAVSNQLRNVQQVQATRWAFAAILADGSVVTWGDPNGGGNSSEVQDQLRNVKQIEATLAAFAAILADGSVVTWGHSEYGGDISEVKDQLQNVLQIEGSQSAFAAILSDGSLVAWGNPRCGGEFKIRTRANLFLQSMFTQEHEVPEVPEVLETEDSAVVAVSDEDEAEEEPEHEDGAEEAEEAEPEARMTIHDEAEDEAAPGSDGSEGEGALGAPPGDWEEPEVEEDEEGEMYDEMDEGEEEEEDDDDEVEEVEPRRAKLTAFKEPLEPPPGNFSWNVWTNPLLARGMGGCSGGQNEGLLTRTIFWPGSAEAQRLEPHPNFAQVPGFYCRSRNTTRSTSFAMAIKTTIASMQAASRALQEGEDRDVKRLQVHKQTRLCKFFAVGQCTRGSACAFAHGQDRLRQQPDFSKTRLCADFMELGSCAEGDGCKFAHGKHELRPGSAAKIGRPSKAGPIIFLYSVFVGDFPMLVNYA
eukprot:s632_g5.t2